MSTNEYNNYPPHYKGLEISKVLREQNIITFFAIDTRTNSIVIEFNHTYQPKTKKVIGPIDLNNWTKFSDKVVKELVSPPIEIERREAMLIKGNLDQEYENIVDTLSNNNSATAAINAYDNNIEKEKEKPKRKITTFKYCQLGKGELYEAVFIDEGSPVFIKYNDKINEFEKN